jgi:hypothetical protein
MKREPNGKQNFQNRKLIFHAQRAGKNRNILVKEIIVFKYSQYPYVAYNTGYQEYFFSLFILLILNENTRKIIDKNGKRQNENIHRLKKHVEIRRGRQQQKPSVLMRNQKKSGSNYNKKEQKFNGIKKHILLFGFFSCCFIILQKGESNA